MNTNSDYNSRDSLPEDHHRGKAIARDAKTHTQDDNVSLAHLKDTPSLSRVASRDSNSRPQVVKIQSQVIKVQSRKESKDIVLDIAGANSSFTSGMFPNGQQEIDMSSQRSLADAGLLLMRNISSSSNYQSGLQDLSPKAADLPQIDDLGDDKGSELNDSGSYTPTKPLNSKSSATLRITKQPSYKTSNFATTKSTFSAHVTPKAREQREEAKMEEDVDITPTGLITGDFTQINDENDRLGANNRALQGNAIDLEANQREDQPRGTRIMTSSNNNITDNVQAELRPAGTRVVPVTSQNEAPAPANNSNTAATTRTTSNAPPAANQVNPRLQRFYLTEAKIYLTKVSLALFCLLVTAIFTLLLSDNKTTIDPLVVTVFCALFFQTIIDVFWTLKVVDQLYLESDQIYNSYDVTAATISLVVIYFKITKLLPISTFACAPLLIITLCYMFFSKAECEDKCLKLGMRIFYTVQVLLITLKLDEKSNWGIVFTMLPCWIAAGLYVSKFVLLACTLSKRVFISSNLSVKLRLTGLLWYTLLYGLTFVTLVILYGVMRTFDGPKPKYESMRFAAHLTIGFSAGLLVFTILARKRLLRFIAIFGLIKSLIAEDEASKAPTEVRRISFQVERKSNYFVMLSSTYFQPLQKNIKSAGREGFEKFKKMLHNLKMGKANPEQEVPAGGEASMKKGVDLQSLRKDKEHLDVKFAKIETSSGASTPARARGKHLTFAVQAKTKGVIRDEDDEEKDDNEDKMIKEKARLALSVGDIEEVSKLNNYLQSPKPKDEDENLCHLCYVNAPDAILMGCGHGGICYDCAVTLVKKKDECLECRGKVDAIYRIDPNPKMANIIKAVEINKLVKTTSVV